MTNRKTTELHRLTPPFKTTGLRESMALRSTAGLHKLMRLRTRSALAAMYAAASLLTGCGIGKQSVNHTNVAATTVGAGRLEFTNRINDLRVTPDATYDATPASGDIYEKVSVVNAAGHHVDLNASVTPIFFEAYWCPHCQRTLVLWNKNRQVFKHMPVIVSMGFPAGTTLRDAVRVSHTEMSTFNIRHLKIYYALSADSSQLVNEYPTLVFPSHSTIALLQGEHTLGVWRRALK